MYKFCITEQELTLEEFWNKGRTHLLSVFTDLSYDCKISKVFAKQNILQEIKFYVGKVEKCDYSGLKSSLNFIPIIGKKILDKLSTVEKFFNKIPNVDRRYLLELVIKEDSLGIENYVLYQNPNILVDLEETFDLEIRILKILEHYGIVYNKDKLTNRVLPKIEDLENEIQMDNEKIVELENKINKLEKTIAHQQDRIRGLLDDVQDLRNDNEKHMRLHDLVDALKDKLDHIPSNEELSIHNLYERIAHRTPPHKYKGKEVWVDLLTGALYDLTLYTVDRDKKGKPNPKRRRFYIHNKYKQAIVDMLKKAS